MRDYNRFSYTAGLIARFLDEHDIKFRPHSSSACMAFFIDHGLSAEFPVTLDGKEYLVAMSIQTCPPVAGPAFAETALSFYDDTAGGGEGPRSNRRPRLTCFFCEEFGYTYDTVIRHSLPDDLYEHILSVKQGVDAKFVQKLLQESDEESDESDDKSDDECDDDDSD